MVKNHETNAFANQSDVNIFTKIKIVQPSIKALEEKHVK